VNYWNWLAREGICSQQYVRTSFWRVQLDWLFAMPAVNEWFKIIIGVYSLYTVPTFDMAERGKSYNWIWGTNNNVRY
jgi:hypothetical protein